jgi:hypothetical protein
LIFSSRFKIVTIRAFQVLMPIFTFAVFTRSFPAPASKGLWLIALGGWEWFAYNIVEASLDVHGLTYRRCVGSKHVRWDMIGAARLWANAGAVVIRLEERSLLRRYKFLLDSRPGMEAVVREPTINDPIEIVRLRQKLAGSIW